MSDTPITANVFIPHDHTDPDTDGDLVMRRVRVDAEERDRYQVHFAGPDGESVSVSAFLNRRNTEALRDALTEAMEWWDQRPEAEA